MQRPHSFFFFFNDTATTEIYTLSLHDALPICRRSLAPHGPDRPLRAPPALPLRSEEHTSELQSHSDLVCRLLLEKKKKKVRIPNDWIKRQSAAIHGEVGTSLVVEPLSRVIDRV